MNNELKNNELKEIEGLQVLKTAGDRVTLEDGTVLRVERVAFSEDSLPMPQCNSCHSRTLCRRLLGRFAMTPHNIIAHPAMELLALFGFRRAALWVHDAILPGFVKRFLHKQRESALSK